MLATKHQRIRSDLKGKIARGIYQPGQALPSQNELMSQYAVAQGTIRQVLQGLQADGLVVSQRGRGTFVNPRPAEADVGKKTMSIGLVIISSVRDDPIVDDQLLAMQHLATEHGYELATRIFREDEEAAVVQWASQHAGTLLWGAARTSTIKQMHQRGQAVVLLGELVDGPCPPGIGWVRYDTHAMLNLALGLLLSLDHRSIWFINRGSSAYFKSLGEHFLLLKDELGLDATTRELVLESSQDESRLVEALAQATSPPTALLIEGDIRACRFIHLLQHAGWAIPQRLSVLALGAAEAHRLGCNGLHRILNSPRLGIAAAMQALVERIEQGHVVRHVIAPVPSPGQTCAARMKSSPRA